ncbi:hypothetical protein FRC03_005836, partial [Tulasnella sp. 419]
VRPSSNFNAPVNDPSSIGIRCNTGARPAPSIASVAAGSTIGFKLDQPINHPGVINVYLGKAPGGATAASWDGSGQSWFKVSQLGAIVNGGTVTFPALGIAEYLFRIPPSTPPGDYLARIEHIAYTPASSYSGTPEFYISCGQISVTGGGTGTPKPLVSFPGVYNPENLPPPSPYPPPTTWPQPGPPVWTG